MQINFTKHLEAWWHALWRLCTDSCWLWQWMKWVANRMVWSRRTSGKGCITPRNTRKSYDIIWIIKNWMIFWQNGVKLTMRHLKACSHVLWSVVKLWGSTLYHSPLCHSRLHDPRLHNPRLGDSQLCDSRLCNSWLCDPRLCDSWLCHPRLYNSWLCDPWLWHWMKRVANRMMAGWTITTYNNSEHHWYT